MFTMTAVEETNKKEKVMNNKRIKHMYVDVIDGDLAVKAVTANGNCTTINLEDGTIETKRAKNEMLDELPTCELVEEISRRKGVYEIRVSPYEFFQIRSRGNNVNDEGPARILIVLDA